MSTRFLFVRHGACSLTDSVLLGRTIDAPLDEHGYRQVQTLARHVARQRPRRIFTSPRLRARQTARILAHRTRCPWQIADELDEMDFGTWSGRSFDELKLDPAWQDWNAHRSRARTPAGEDIRKVQGRIHDFLRGLHRTWHQASLVLVTHAEIIRSALLDCLELPAEDYRRIDVAPASLHVLRADGNRIRIEAASDRGDAAKGQAA